MSGPKVVRIVTREEIEAICRRHIAAAKAAAQEFTRRADRCGRLDDAARQALAERIAALQALLVREEWMAVQKQAPATIAFLQAEAERLEKSAVAQAAQARNRRRQTAGAARSIAAVLRTAGLTVDPALTAAAENWAASPEEADRAIAAGLTAIPAKGGTAAQAAERAGLAARLAAGEAGRTVHDLVRSPPAASVDEQRLDALLAELHVLGDDAAPLARRADAIAGETDAGRRRLLTDSLVMDVAGQVARLRAREAIDAELRQAAAMLGELDAPEADALRGKLEALVGRADKDSAATLRAEITAAVEARTRAIAAAARRRAVLGGLSALGYEVRESMASAWERDGRVVLRKPGATDYGVELAAPADAARFQVRLVGAMAPETPRDARRDADQEVIWCGEFDRLRAGLGVDGDELVIEKAVEAGALPLRSVAMPGETRAEAAGTARPALRRNTI